MQASPELYNWCGHCTIYMVPVFIKNISALLHYSLVALELLFGSGCCVVACFMISARSGSACHMQCLVCFPSRFYSSKVICNRYVQLEIHV